MFSAKKMRTACAVFISLAISLSVFVSAGAKTGKLSGDDVNLRKSPSLKGAVLNVLNKGTTLNVLSKGKKWSKVKVKGQVGYVSSDFVKVQSTKSSTKKSSAKKSSSKKTVKTKSVSTKSGWIKGNNVNLRKSPSMSGKVIGSLDYANKVTVYSNGSKWAKVKTASGKIGYVSKDYVSSKQLKKKAKKTNRNGSVAASGRAKKLIAYAKKFIGTKYVYGGTSPAGFDCSGFVYYCFRNSLGITLSGRSSSAMAATTKKIKRSQLKPGDLIYFARGSRIYHVALYIGDGKMIHAETRAGINIDPVSEYNSTYHSAGRVL